MNFRNLLQNMQYYSTLSYIKKKSLLNHIPFGAIKHNSNGPCLKQNSFKDFNLDQLSALVCSAPK